MNELVFFGLLILMFTRLIGLGTSLNFFYDLRKTYFLYYIFAWIFGIIGNIFSLTLDLVRNTILSEFILMLNALLVSLSMILLMIGLFSYFLKIKFSYITLSCIIIILIAILLYIFLDYNISIVFSVVIMNSTILIGFILPLSKLKIFKKFIGKSIRWYYITCGSVFGFIPISFYIFMQGYGYGLYNTNNIPFIILNYTIGIFTHFLFVVFFIHFEYTISNEQQNQLKDKYSHNLGNIMQVIYSSAELFKRHFKLENSDKDKLDLIETKCKEAAKLINEIRNI